MGQALFLFVFKHPPYRELVLGEVGKACEGTSGTGVGKLETQAVVFTLLSLSFPTWDIILADSNTFLL